MWRYKNSNLPFSYTEVVSGRPVAQLDEQDRIIGIWWRSVDCANDLGITRPLVSKLCTGEQKALRRRTLKLKFITKEEYRQIIEENDR